MDLFYSPSLQKNATVHQFDRAESKHIAKVLRKKVNDLIEITNGNGLLCRGKLSEVQDRICTLRITEQKIMPQTAPPLHVAIAPTKMNDRFEWFLEKASEIGIQQITPIICDHSERTVLKPERLHKILVAALKQSKQYYLPRLNVAMNFNELINQNNQGQLFIAHCNDNFPKKTLQKCLSKPEAVTILIGPEGDFSLTEIEQALAVGYTSVSLGNTRLRTETAGVVACHTTALHFSI